MPKAEFRYSSKKNKSLRNLLLRKGRMESSDREKTEIFISCRSLIDTDTFSKTDAFVIVSVPHPHQLGKWTELHRTETIMDNLNPNFTKSVVIEHIFEIQ